MNRKTPKSYSRRVSEDVASLDSWSEALSDDVSTLTVNDKGPSLTPVDLKARKNSSNNQLLLNPAKLVSQSSSRNAVRNRNEESGRRFEASSSGPSRNPSEQTGVKFDISTSDPFDIDDGSFDNINSVYLSLPEGHGACLKESYSTISTSENNLDYNDCSHSLPDLTAVNSKTRTYPPHYVHPKSLQYPTQGETSEKVKNKLMSMWNNVKYGQYTSLRRDKENSQKLPNMINTFKLIHFKNV